MAGELFKMMALIDMIHVPYRGGGQVMTDLIAGQVQVSFIGLTVAIEHIKTGKLRALGVTAATRSDVLPDIPTAGDFVPGYEAAPRASAHPEYACRHHRQAQPGDQRRPLRSRAQEASTDGGGTVLAGSPADFGKFIGGETRSGAR